MKIPQFPNYVLLDGAQMGFELDEAKEVNPEHVCLFKGNQALYMGLAAPWLFTFKKNDVFAEWLQENALGQNWSVFFHSAEPFETIYEHLHQLLFVQTEGNEKKYFRYYDPRVVNVLLPIFDPDQINAFFGPITVLFAETQDRQLNKIEKASGMNFLKQSKMPWNELFV